MTDALTGTAADDLRHRLVSLRFPATQAAVRDALVTVDTTLVGVGAPEDLRTRTQITLAEACNNIVEHAYPAPFTGSGAVIALDIAGHRGGLQITLRDRGRAMPEGPLPGRELPPIDPDNVQALPEGGFGWALLREMTRAISVSRRNGLNILRFRLPHADKPDPSGRNAT